MDASLTSEIRRIVLQLTQSNNGSINKEFKEIKEQVEINVTDIRNTNLKLDGIRGQVASISDSVAAIERRLGEVDGRLVVITNQITQLSNSVSQNTQDISAMGDRLNAIEPRIDDLDTLTSNLAGRTSTLETDVGGIRAELSALTTRITTEVARLDALISAGQASLTSLSSRLDAVEAVMITTAGQGLRKDGNTLNVIVGNGMWFNNSNQLQLDLSNQAKGVGFEGGGVVAKIDTNYFSYNSNGEITLVNQISGLPARVSTLESLKIDTILPPLTVSEASGARTLSLGYDTNDFTIINSVLSLRSRLTLPTYRYPLELDASNNRVQIAERFGMRTGSWTGQLQYQHPQLSWQANVTVNLMKVDDWLVLSFTQMTTSGIMADGKFIINFLSGLSSGWQTGETQPSSTTDPLSTTFVAVQYLNAGGTRVDAFRIMGVSEWIDGELEIKNYGGTYTSHTQVYWAPWTIMYPCNVR
uniref:Viral attachment protein sigma 1 n=1 Tax=Reovirus type 1 (strain Lang) TaxID=10884 RepID=Q5G2A0_REOVL|nr:viral attachment protein sigma 1 [Mammalian orthoreovirus 1]